MATLAKMQETLAADAQYREVKEFTGAVRSLENNGLEVGDEWIFPTEYKVYEQKFGDAVTQLILIELTNGQCKPFYPSTFTKSRSVVDVEGEPTGERVHTKGTAASFFRESGSVKEAMNRIAGKKVKVTAIDVVKCKHFTQDRIVNAQIPTIDFVD